MRVMLHGFVQGNNFGDVLFAHLFYRKCRKIGFDQIDFWQSKKYGIGSFCRKELGYDSIKSPISCLKSDVFILISGGYLWNECTKSRDARWRYHKYVLPALIYQLLGKPVYILGVGGGPVDTPWLKDKMVKMLNKARLIYFRDEYTKQVFDGYGVHGSIVTADTALVLKPEMLDAFAEKRKMDIVAKGKKRILLHVPDGLESIIYLNNMVLPGIVEFLSEHKEYLLVLSKDNNWNVGNKAEAEEERLRVTLEEQNIVFYDYQYHDTWQMCSLINEMDLVVSLKLHVGVVGCALGKSVVAFPIHREKVDNFYYMIGESDRCVNIRKLTNDKVKKQLIKYCDKPVHISDELRLKAEQNLSVLGNIAAGRI